MEDIENHMVLPHADDDLKPVTEREAQLLDQIEDLKDLAVRLENEVHEARDEAQEWRKMFMQASLAFDRLAADSRDMQKKVRDLLDALNKAGLTGDQA